MTRIELARARAQAYGVLCSAAVPRPAGSSFMPLRRAPHRPAPLGGFGFPCGQSNNAGYRSAWVEWRSEIKEDLATLGRRGGHSRSYSPQVLRCEQAALKLNARAMP
jgi:hypothetical protein